MHAFSLRRTSRSTFHFPGYLVLREGGIRPHPFKVPRDRFRLLGKHGEVVAGVPIHLLALDVLALERGGSF